MVAVQKMVGALEGEIDVMSMVKMDFLPDDQKKPY